MSERALHERAQFLWIGARLSSIERLALTSFRDHGWDVTLFVYDEIENVPKGVRIADGNEILRGSRIFADNFEGARVPRSVSFTTFADQFRIHLLVARGGWWFDADMVALGPPLAGGERRPFYVASTFEGEWKTCAINCAMFCHPGDPVMVAMRDEADAIVASGNFEFGETGPFLLQRILQERNMSDAIAPFHEFCPFPWRLVHMAAFRSNRELAINAARFVKHRVWERTRTDFKAAYVRRGSRFVHLHNEIWRRAGISKGGPFHPWSFVGRAMKRHSIIPD